MARAAGCRMAEKCHHDARGRTHIPGKKILMLVGDFTEEYEIFVFEQAMHAVGHIVHVVCPDKRAGDVLNFAARFRGRPELHGEARPQLHPGQDVC